MAGLPERGTRDGDVDGYCWHTVGFRNAEARLSHLVRAYVDRDAQLAAAVSRSLAMRGPRALTQAQVTGSS
jgi:hypothetical protein